MKSIKKKLVAVVLAVNMLVIGIFGSYQTAQAAEIVAGYGAAQILESILLSFGISIFTADMIKNGSNATWWDTDGSAALKPYYDDLEQAYEEQRFKVINGGGGQDPQPSPTPAPGNTPIPFPTTAPVPGDIPTFKELVAPALAGTAAVINMTQGAWECMSKAVSSLWNKMMGTTKSELENNGGFTQEVADNWDSISYPYYVYITVEISLGTRYCFNLFPNGTFWVKVSDGKYFINKPSGTKMQYLETRTDKEKGYIYKGNTSNFNYYSDDDITNIPFFENVSDGIAWREQQLANADKYVKENIWVHPDLQDTYKNNGKLEYPQQAPRPLQIPTADQLADTVKKLNPEINPNYSPEVAPNYIQELIQQLQKQPDPNPDPNPNPNPNPNPDPNPDPKPDPNPDPNPDPELTPKPDEDNSNDIDPKNYTTDLKKIFPFCIPFDLVHLIQAFEAEPEAPVFEFPFDLELENPWTGKKILDYHHTFKLDMSDYEPVIKIFRIFEIIFFIIGLLMITRQQMIKG